MPNDGSTFSTRVPVGGRISGPNRGLASSASFSDVLKDLSINEEEVNTLGRPALPILSDGNKQPIIFQCIDTTESECALGGSEIHLFGATEAGHSILARVLGFQHYLYYPAPSRLSQADLVPLCKYLNDLLKTPAKSKRLSPSTVVRIELRTEKISPEGKESLYLRIYLSNHNDMKDRPAHIFNLGKCQYKNLFASGQGRSCEAQVPYHLRFMLDNKINAMSWLKLPADVYKIIPEARRVSTCQLEVSIQYHDKLIRSSLLVNNQPLFAPLRILSYDIETNIPENLTFPNATKDAIIQIGNMVSTYGQSGPTIRTIFTVDSCSPIDGAQVRSFNTEADMLLAWKKFVLEVDPDVVTGYNITKFDIPYILNRATALSLTQFPHLGRLKSWRQVLPAPYMRIEQFADCPGYNGRLILDVFNHIRDYYPLLNGSGQTKLNNVAKEFLGDKKEDLSYDQIPALQKGGPDTRRTIAIYCLKDTYLPLRLLAKLECLEKEVRAAKEAHVPFNVMRERAYLKRLSRDCRNAVDWDYILVDPRGSFAPDFKR